MGCSNSVLRDGVDRPSYATWALFDTSIFIVNAFNFEAFGLDTITRTFDALSCIACTLNTIWGATTALAQFAIMVMFV